jgi:Putative mono-oxygenase ydhR
MIVAVVRFSLPKPMTLEEATAVFESSAPSYQALDGLRRKHYLLSEDRLTAGGVYLWDNRAQAERLYDDAWRTKLTARYGTPPTVEFFDSPVTVEADAITIGCAGRSGALPRPISTRTRPRNRTLGTASRPA